MKRRDVHHAARRRGGMASRGVRAAAGNAGDRVPHSATPCRTRRSWRAFRQGLSEAGYVEGRNVAIEYRWAENQLDRLPALAADLVRRQVAVILAGGSADAALAAKAATSTIPIVFANGADPVEFGLVASLNRPGGNVTGVSFLVVALGQKKLELPHALVPAATVIAVLLNPNPRLPTSSRKTCRRRPAPSGCELHVLHASTDRDFDAAFASLAHFEPARS